MKHDAMIGPRDERCHVLWLPGYFHYDHCNRALPGGVVIAEVPHPNGAGYHSLRVKIKATPAELAEIRSDASYYAGDGAPDGMGPYGPPLFRSARATVRAIDKYLAKAKALCGAQHPSGAKGWTCINEAGHTEEHRLHLEGTRYLNWFPPSD